MRLSEYILLGRHTIEKPKPNDITACAITMALNAAGRTCTPSIDDPNGFKAYESLIRQWPWLTKTAAQCPWCDLDLSAPDLGASQIVYHPFDIHVMSRKQITLEQMCDWIRSIEPPEPEPVHDGSTFSKLEEMCERAEANAKG